VEFYIAIWLQSKWLPYNPNIDFANPWSWDVLPSSLEDDFHYLSSISFIKFITRYNFNFWCYCVWYCFPDFFSDFSLFAYRNATALCVLILYLTTLLNVFMNSKSFLVEFFKSFRYKIISFANRDNLTSFFSTWVFFISFSYLIALLLNKSGESKYFCLLERFLFPMFLSLCSYLQVTPGMTYPFIAQRLCLNLLSQLGFCSLTLGKNVAWWLLPHFRVFIFWLSYSFKDYYQRLLPW
jgi:hypothetical protein